MEETPALELGEDAGNAGGFRRWGASSPVHIAMWAALDTNWLDQQACYGMARLRLRHAGATRAGDKGGRLGMPGCRDAALPLGRKADSQRNSPACPQLYGEFYAAP